MSLKYSIVIPVFNEFSSILPLYHDLCKVMTGFRQPYEIIFINDGGDQAGPDYWRPRTDENIFKIINLNRHYGQTKALACGFREARGEIIISMDGDLQDQPKYIPYFIDKVSQGFDVVCGYRIKRRDAKNKIILSKIGNFLQKIILRTSLNDISCTFRIYNKECLKNLRLIRNGYHRYIPFILIRQGYKVTEITIEQGTRLFGRSKYSFLKIPQVVASLFFLILDILMKRI